MRQPIEFRWSAQRLGWLASLITLIGLGGLALLGQEDWTVKALGLAWAAAFGYGAYALNRRRAIRTPVVIVSQAGLHDTRISGAPLPWSAISRIEEFEVEHMTYVGLHLRDDAALATLKRGARVGARLNSAIRLPPVSISMAPLDGGDDDLLAAIAVFRPELVAETG